MGDWDLVELVLTLVDVSIVYYLVYRILLIIRGTRAVPMLTGILVLILLYFVSEASFLRLQTFSFLLQQFIGSMLLIVVILFQADIRRALTIFGRTHWLSGFRSGAEAQVVDELVKAAQSLARQTIGALIVVERDADLQPYMEEGARVEAKLSKELLYALFVPERQNPLHDGAVVISQGRVAAAGVFLPMSVNPHLDRSLGTRHRAALGLSEETDAVVIVVSEERGAVSVAMHGRIEIDLSSTELRELLTHVLIRRPTRLFGRDKGAIAVAGRKPASDRSPPTADLQPDSITPAAIDRSPNEESSRAP